MMWNTKLPRVPLETAMLYPGQPNIFLCFHGSLAYLACRSRQKLYMVLSSAQVNWKSWKVDIAGNPSSHTITLPTAANTVCKCEGRNLLFVSTVNHHLLGARRTTEIPELEPFPEKLFPYHSKSLAQRPYKYPST